MSTQNLCKNISFFLDWNRNVLIDKIEDWLPLATQGREEEILSYRDDSGRSALNIFICALARGYHVMINQSLSETCDVERGAFFLLGELLRIGFDPTERFYDVVTCKTFISSLDALALCTDYLQSTADPHVPVPLHLRRVALLAECGRMMSTRTMRPLPTLPQQLSFLQLNQMQLDVAKLVQVPKVLAEYIPQLFMKDILYCEKSSPCTLCQPAVQLIFTALQRGVWLEKMQRIVPILLAHIVYLRRPYFNPCCQLELLQLLLDCSVGILHKSSMQRLQWYYRQATISVPYKYIYQDAMNTLLGHLTTFDTMRLRYIVPLLWMYKPSCKRSVVRYLHQLREEDVTGEKQDFVLRYKILIESVKPLSLLSRVIILRHMEWHDVSQQNLLLPNALVRYLQVGDFVNTSYF